MRVFGPYVLVDRLSDRLYVRTINIYGCMHKFSRYTWGFQVVKNNIGDDKTNISGRDLIIG